jgi:hypothetical protein
MEKNIKFLIKFFIHEIEIIKKRINFSVYFLILHILFTLNTTLFAFNDQKLTSINKNYLNFLSMLFSLITCVIILIYELINCHKKLKFIIQCVIFSCFCVSSKFISFSFFFFLNNKLIYLLNKKIYSIIQL